MNLPIAIAVFAFAMVSASAQPMTVETSSRAEEWTIKYNDKIIMVYAFDRQKFKPYVKVLNTMDGYGPLRDSPPDHLHHHGLMYGIMVNGVNFWEETAGCGVEKVIESPPPEIGRNTAGLMQARVVQLLYWLAPEDAFLPSANAPALLIERRTLLLTVNPKNRETALHWKAEFQVGSKSDLVTLTGTKYDGLGMRFEQELDPIAVHFSPDGQPDLSNFRQERSQEPWEAVSFDVPAKPETIALLGGNARYFAMKKPFAYLSATQGLYQQPQTCRRGDHFELNYLVVLYPEIKPAKALDERYQQWTIAKE